MQPYLVKRILRKRQDLKQWQMIGGTIYPEQYFTEKIDRMSDVVFLEVKCQILFY